MIFDTHAHYDDHRFDEDRERILNSLRSFGVDRVVNVAADMEGAENSVALAGAYDFIYASVGVHPDGIDSLTEKDMDILKKYTELPKVVAVGEIGLDYYDREEILPELQKKWFARQMDLALEVDLPVIIHSRDAARDTYDILKSYGYRENGGIIHCFSYSKEMARQFLDLGYYIALGGVVTFKNGRVAKEVAQYVPADRLLLETDSPYLTPVPHRGKRNFSGYLTYVADEMAALRGITREELEQITWDNANRLYRIKE